MDCELDTTLTPTDTPIWPNNTIPMDEKDGTLKSVQSNDIIIFLVKLPIYLPATVNCL